MKFLILTQYFLPEIGAAQTRLDAMVRQLTARGHEVEVVTALPNYPQGRIHAGYERTFYRCERLGGIPIHRVWLVASAGAGSKRLLNYLSFSLTCMWALLKPEKPDFVFIESPPLFLGVPGLLAARLWGVPAIFNVADLWPDSIVDMGLMKDGLPIRTALKLERWLYRNMTYITAVTEGIRDTLLRKKGVPAEKVLFLPNGVDLEQCQPRSPDSELKAHLGLDGKKIILYQGTQGFAHGLSAVLHTANLLRDDSDIHFLFVGAGSERSTLEALKSKLGLTNVSFHDPVPMATLARFFSIAECGLVSLRDTPLFRGARPAKVNSILGFAKPVIFFGQGEGANLVRQAGAGLLVNHGDLQGLAAAVRRVIRDPDFAAQMGRNARQYAETHLSWSILIDDWLNQLLPQTQSVEPALAS
jgi:colanic acid biosynthesis glycosyl transferase WcaI